MSSKITPFLWFDHEAEEAAKFYTSIFPNSRIKLTTRYGEAGPGPAGSEMTVAFELDGQDFTALNGGPHYTISPAVSFVVHCETQHEVDHYWDKLCEGGKPVQCGWLTDRYGVSWQVVPDVLIEMLQDKNAARAKSVTQAMMKMIKLDIPTLRRAYDEAA
jgi:predicted 3-demethylubiquinone-9 3-methyltransferase (glyoxalase superfamily)